MGPIPPPRNTHTTPLPTTLPPLLTWVKYENPFKTPPTRCARLFLFGPLQWLEETLGPWTGYKSTEALNARDFKRPLSQNTLPSLNWAHSCSMCAASPDRPGCQLSANDTCSIETSVTVTNTGIIKPEAVTQTPKTRVGSKASVYRQQLMCVLIHSILAAGHYRATRVKLATKLETHMA